MVALKHTDLQYRHLKAAPEQSVLPLIIRVLIAVVACSPSHGIDADSGVKLNVSATRFVLLPAESTRLGFIVVDGQLARFSPGLGTEPTLTAASRVSWTLSDSTVASVAVDGMLVSIAPGRTVVRIDYGQLSDSGLIFVRPAGDEITAQFVEIGVGVRHACGLTVDGSVFCWGSSWFGETGLGTTRQFTSTVSPARVEGLSRVTQLTVGDRHTCALTEAGHAYCWGEELSLATPAGANPRPTPWRVGSDTRFSTISAGGELACGILIDGSLRCWGFRLAGLVAVAGPGSLVQISAGYNHVCGLNESRQAMCFGRNESGQLGTGDRSTRDSFVFVQTPLRFVSVSAGHDYTCAVSVESRAYCWGTGGNGVLGTGDASSRLTPDAVVGLADVDAIDVGTNHTCARSRSGTAYCWGEDLAGQLGDGPPRIPNPTAADLRSLVPSRVEMAANISNIAAGWGESACALDSVGAAYCWGSNGVGQLGVGRHDLAVEPLRRISEIPARVRMVR